MTSAGSTSRGITTELQVISHDDPVLEYDQTRFDESQVAGYFYNQTPEMALLSPPPQGLARPPGPKPAASMRYAAL
jgi:hypothetical protein